jgi:hypothetical protein
MSSAYSSSFIANLVSALDKLLSKEINLSKPRPLTQDCKTDWANKAQPQRDITARDENLLCKHSLTQGIVSLTLSTENCGGLRWHALIWSTRWTSRGPACDRTAAGLHLVLLTASTSELCCSSVIIAYGKKCRTRKIKFNNFDPFTSTTVVISYTTCRSP